MNEFGRGLAWGGVATVLLLGGCSQKPEYSRPVAPIPAHWPQGDTVGDRVDLARMEWQRFYADPRLKALIASAIEHNRDLRVATARVAEARAFHGIREAERLPAIDLGAGDAVTRLPHDVSGLGRAVVSRRYDVNLGIAAFELDFWGRVASLRDAALADYLSSEQAQRSFRLALIADVAELYLIQLELTERLSLANSTLKSRDETRRLIDKRREVGLAGDLDYLSAEAAYYSVQSDIASLRRQRDVADNAMRLLVGVMPGDLPDSLGLDFQGLNLEPAVGLPADVLLRRPDIQTAELALMAANANIGAARAAFFPRVALTTTLGTASSALSGLFDAGSEAWLFQPRLTLPLFDGGRRQADLDVAEARKVMAVAQYEKAIQQAFREVTDLLAARTRLREQIEAQTAAERNQAQRLKIVEARYKGGIASYLELLDAQRELLALQQGLVQSRRQWLSTTNLLFKTLGAAGRADRLSRPETAS